MIQASLRSKIELTNIYSGDRKDVKRHVSILRNRGVDARLGVSCYTGCVALFVHKDFLNAAYEVMNKYGEEKVARCISHWLKTDWTLVDE